MPAFNECIKEMYAEHGDSIAYVNSLFTSWIKVLDCAVAFDDDKYTYNIAQLRQYMSYTTALFA